MTSPGSSNWQSLGPMGINTGGSPVTGTQAMIFRDSLDAERAGIGLNNRVPGAEFPDGYLGTMNSRRAGRMLDTLTTRLQDRAYQRGVHKGEKLPPNDYFWPADFDPSARLMEQASTPPGPDRLFHVPRPAPVGTVAEHLLADSRSLPRGAAGLMEIRPTKDNRVSQLQALSPEWR